MCYMKDVGVSMCRSYIIYRALPRHGTLQIVCIKLQLTKTIKSYRKSYPPIKSLF